MNKSEIDGDQISIRQVAKVAGAFVAWIIGAGFATGREILSFFSSFGYYSYGGKTQILDNMNTFVAKK